jgi:hypothetical protein
VTALAWVVFVLVLAPISWWRRLTGLSRFGRRYHRSASAWDRGVLAAHPVVGEARDGRGTE